MGPYFGWVGSKTRRSHRREVEQKTVVRLLQRVPCLARGVGWTPAPRAGDTKPKPLPLLLLLPLLVALPLALPLPLLQLPLPLPLPLPLLLQTAAPAAAAMPHLSTLPSQLRCHCTHTLRGAGGPPFV